MPTDRGALDEGIGHDRRLLAAAAGIGAITVLARLAGFGRVLVFARVVGPTCLGDVYTTANTIPNIVFDVVAGGALSSLVVPVVAGRIAAGDDDGARRIVGALLGWMLLLLVPISLIGALLARPLMDLLVGPAHGGCPRTVEVSLGASMLRVFAPQIVLYGVGVVLTGSLQARRRFTAAALAPLASSLVVVGIYLAFGALGHPDDLSNSLHVDTVVLAGGTTLGVAALSLPLLIPALRNWGVPLGLRFPPGVGATVIKLAAAGAVVLGSQQLSTAVVLRLANADGVPGSVVAWTLGWTVFLLPWAILAVPVATSAFPVLSAHWHAGETARHAQVVASTTRLVAVLAAGSAGLLLSVAVPAARVLILGAPGSLPPAVLARTLTAFAPGLFGYGLLAQLSRVRYSRGDARGPAAATATGWLVSIVVDLSVAPHVAAASIPALLGAAASAGITIAAVMLTVPVLRDLATDADAAPGPGPGPALVRTLAAATGAGAAAAVAGRLITALLPQGGVALAVLDVAVGAAVAVAATAAVIAVLDPDVFSLLRLRARGA